MILPEEFLAALDIAQTIAEFGRTNNAEMPANFPPLKFYQHQAGIKKCRQRALPAFETGGKKSGLDLDRHELTAENFQTGQTENQ